MLLLNPTWVLAIAPAERDGVEYSQIHVQGYTFSAAETVEEIEAIIQRHAFNGPTIEGETQKPRALSR